MTADILFCTDLQHRPKTCTKKAAAGDMVSVHYTVRSSSDEQNEEKMPDETVLILASHVLF